MHSFFRLLLRPWQRSCAIFRSSLSELPDLGDGIFTGTEPVQRQIFRSKMRSWRAGPLVCSLGWLGLDSGLNHCFGAGRGFQFWIELGSAKANLHPPVQQIVAIYWRLPTTTADACIKLLVGMYQCESPLPYHQQWLLWAWSIAMQLLTAATSAFARVSWRCAQCIPAWVARTP